MYRCPQCGELTEVLYDGYCHVCHSNNQAALRDYSLGLADYRDLRDTAITKAINQARGLVW